MKDIVCIAGKNTIAINGLNRVMEEHPAAQILALPNRGDDGIDGWQPSFRRYAGSRGIRETTLEELYRIENLTFISLEFADLLKPSRFSSDALFNIHFSLLPKYKGMYTSAMPILNGEETTGVTLHRIDDGIDTGDIIDQISFKLDDTFTARDLYHRYLEYGFSLFEKNISQLLSGAVQFSQQRAKGASYFSKRSIDYSNITIDFSKTAYEIHNQIRAFTFREYQLPIFQEWPIARSTMSGMKSEHRAGTVIEESDEGFIVSTIDYDIRLTKDYYDVLWQAAEDGDVDQLLKALSYIGDIDLRGKHGWNALIIAAYHSRHDIVRLLLTRGANPSATNYKGTTALMYALSGFERSGDDRALRLLLDSGADKSARDSFGHDISYYLKRRAAWGAELPF